MYQIVIIEDIVRVPPQKLSLDIESAIKESIREKLEGKIDNLIGVMLDVIEVKEVGEGKIIPGDGAVHYSCKFSLLTWMPKDHEVVEGSVVDITEFGAFVRIGPLDGFIHISQVMDDFVSYDEKNSQLVGRESRKILKVGDSVKARIISVSLKEQNKVGLTMRQPFLGAAHWLKAKEKEEAKVAKEEAKEKKAEEKEKKEEKK